MTTERQKCVNSIKTLIDAARVAALRFTWPLISAGVASFLLCFSISFSESLDGNRLLTAISTLALLMVSLLALDLYAEARSLNKLFLPISRAILLLAAALYWIFIPEYESEIIRYVLLSLAAHLLISFAPFSLSDKDADFWSFNRSIFVRILASVFFSTVLANGIALGFLAITALLGIDVPGSAYAYIYVLSHGIFNTWFFLYGIPSQFQNISEQKQKLILQFAQFILFPLVTMYLAILYIYISISFTGLEWPKLKLTWLVAAFSAPGILCFLLLFPFQLEEKSTWIIKARKYFFIALLPLSLVMLISVYLRVSVYGFTELMYIASAAGLWLSGISLYFIFYKNPVLQMIPRSLALILLLISWGPWGALNVARYSQSKILTGLLEKHNLIDKESGKLIIPEPAKAPAKITEPEIIRKVEYLTEHFGIESIIDLFPMQNSVSRPTSTQEAVYFFTNDLNIESENQNSVYYDFFLERTGGTDYIFTIRDFSKMREFNIYNEKTLMITPEIENEKCNNVDLSAYINNLIESRKETDSDSLLQKNSVLKCRTQTRTITIQFKRIAVSIEDDKKILSAADGYYFY